MLKLRIDDKVIESIPNKVDMLIWKLGESKDSPRAGGYLVVTSNTDLKYNSNEDPDIFQPKD